MRFIDPLFLYALLLVLLPILIHILQFKRYKTVYFSQVGFLKAIKQESKKKNDLKQLLILLSRILAIIFLVLAFSQPYIPVSPTERKAARQLVGVYIDNSFSMKRMAENGSLLELAKNKAVEIANSYGPGTDFMLLTNQNDIGLQQLLTREQFIAQVAKTDESPVSLPLSRGMRLLENRMDKTSGSAGRSLYLLSDFQQFSSDFDQLEPDSNLHVLLVPFEAPADNNLMIDSCWVETPGRRPNQTENLHVRVKNLSGQTVQNLPVRLMLNDSLKAVNTLTIGPNETAEFQLNYRNNRQGAHLGKVEIDDYPVVFDNTCYFSYQVVSKVNVLVISPSGQVAVRYLEKLFRNDENMLFEQVEDKKIQLSQINRYQCIFLLNLDELPGGLTAALLDFVRQGGTLCIFPGIDADLPAYNKLFRELAAGSIGRKDTSSQRMAEINYQHLLFREVFLHEKEKPELPFLKATYRLQTGTNSPETRIITTNSGNPALAEYPYGLGRLYQFSFPLDQAVTDFYKQALFVPVLYNMALNSSEPQVIQYPLAGNQAIELRKKAEFLPGNLITITRVESGDESQLPVLNDRGDYFSINPTPFTNEAGFYRLSKASETFMTLAFNYNRKESLSPFYAADELVKLTGHWQNTPQVIDSKLPDFQQRIQEANKGTELWKYFILLALLFVLTEAAIIRFWK